MLDIQVNLSELRDLAARCRRVAPALEKDLQVGLVAGGEIVASAVRRNANAFQGRRRTSRIADSVAVRRRGVRVRVQAGGASAPEAAPIENHGDGGSFRHPVPNTGKWVDQPAHDFMVNAGEESVGEVEAFLGEMIDVTLARLIS